jgi:pimeloyl-ACP methyl ester carboxylesterase
MPYVFPSRVLTAVCAISLGTLAACDGADSPTHISHDPALRDLYLYDASDTAHPAHPARALIFFLGNDVGFWEPHRKLAVSLTKAQYAVAGVDIRPILRTLPDCVHGERERAFADTMRTLIQRTRHELGADSIPLIIAGHSLGAELAIWTAAHVQSPGTLGVLAMSPGTRSHLRISVADIMNGPEPTGPESFSVADEIKLVPSSERVAIVRGTRDKYSQGDSTLIASGGNRADRFLVPFAGHSLKRIATASFESRRALEWLITGR